MHKTKPFIRERASAGIVAARMRGVRMGRPAEDADAVAAKLAVAREAIRTRGKTAAQAAALVGWSRSTLYRHGGGGSRSGPDCGG